MGCVSPSRRAWSINDDYLFVSTLGGVIAYARVPVDDELADDFHYVADGIACPLRLELVQSAGGSGGLFLPGLIMLGVEDLERLTDAMIQATSVPLSPLAAAIARFRGDAVWSRDDYLAFVRRRVLRHEVGHAVDSAGGLVTPFRHPELRADYFAGMADGIEGVNLGMSNRFFGLIGCLLSPCSHPPPAHRMAAHARGVAEAQQAAIAAGGTR